MDSRHFPPENSPFSDECSKDLPNNRYCHITVINQTHICNKAIVDLRPLVGSPDSMLYMASKADTYFCNPVSDTQDTPSLG